MKNLADMGNAVSRILKDNARGSTGYKEQITRFLDALKKNTKKERAIFASQNCVYFWLFLHHLCNGAQTSRIETPVTATPGKRARLFDDADSVRFITDLETLLESEEMVSFIQATLNSSAIYAYTDCCLQETLEKNVLFSPSRPERYASDVGTDLIRLFRTIELNSEELATLPDRTIIEAFIKGLKAEEISTPIKTLLAKHLPQSTTTSRNILYPILHSFMNRIFQETGVAIPFKRSTLKTRKGDSRNHVVIVLNGYASEYQVPTEEIHQQFAHPILRFTVMWEMRRNLDDTIDRRSFPLIYQVYDPELYRRLHSSIMATDQPVDGAGRFLYSDYLDVTEEKPKVQQSLTSKFQRGGSRE